MAVSDSPWNFSEADYTPQQLAKAALIDTEEGPPDSKERYKLPVLEPSGAVNRNGVHAAAERLNQVEGVSTEKRAAAARKLVSLYRNDLGETPPDHLLSMAGSGERSLGAPPIERIFTKADVQLVEVRSGGKSRTIGGYAAVFNRPSENLGGFIERIESRFFNKSKADNWPGVVCRYNHKDDFLLGATHSGTLQLSIDGTGLDYSVDLPECRNDVLEMVTRRDIFSSSFAFQAYEDDWSLSDQGYPMRSLVSGRLIDVAPVSTPAYRDATVAKRSLAEHMHAPIEDVVKLAECDELRKLFKRTDIDGGYKPKPTQSGRAAQMWLLARRPEDPFNA
jgi:HK97 family phage prohead protease